MPCDRDHRRCDPRRAWRAHPSALSSNRRGQRSERSCAKMTRSFIEQRRERHCAVQHTQRGKSHRPPWSSSHHQRRRVLDRRDVGGAPRRPFSSDGPAIVGMPGGTGACARAAPVALPWETRIWPRKLRVFSCFGCGEELLRRRVLDDAAVGHEDDAVGDAAREAHLVGHAEHRHAVLGQADHGVEHLLDHLRVERRGRLVEQHDLRVHAEGARNRDALLLAARELARVLVRLLRDADPRQVLHRRRLGFRRAQAARAHRRQRAVLQHGQVREQVELLEHHADLAAHRVDVAATGGEVDAVDDDAALLRRLEPVDAADQRRLARARGPADDDPLAGAHRQVDVGQDLEVRRTTCRAPSMRMIGSAPSCIAHGIAGRSGRLHRPAAWCRAISGRACRARRWPCSDR